MKQVLPRISVCIPVFQSEASLEECLLSVVSQDFNSFEILIVNDGSRGMDKKGRSCRKIIKAAQKEGKKLRKEKGLSPPAFCYIEHRSNLGLLEARRSAVLKARGEYICIVDSDDQLLPSSLSRLYEAASRSNADLVQGGAEIALEKMPEERTQGDDGHSSDTQALSPAQKETLRLLEEKANLRALEPLQGSAVFQSFLPEKKQNAFLWAKLIRRSVYLKALEEIPFSFCVFGEDFLQYFFIARAAQSYEPVKESVYRYRVDTGISSSKKITTLSQWQKVCSTASVFTIIFDAVKKFQPQLTLEQMEELRTQSRSYLANNILQLRTAVIPSLQTEARTLLCQWWGEDFVELMENKMDEGEGEKSVTLK